MGNVIEFPNQSRRFNVCPGHYTNISALRTVYLNFAINEVFDDGDEEQAQRWYERAELFNDIYQEGI